MRCAHCQQENPSGMKFCGECGARLDASCPACRASNPPGNKFCGECGAQLLRLASSPTKFESPKSYIPKHLAEKILTSKGMLEGERKQVTVLFADMKGSMELLADRDPEDARKLLDPILEHMMEAVHRYEGTVNQVMGDGIMALFGAPLAHEDHAVRACYSALRMQESLKRYAERIQRTEGIPIQIRMGVNSGEVVIRSIGSDLKMDYTAVGQTTHLAARMEQMAMPGSILITADTLSLTEGFVQVKPLGPVNVKGLNDPVEVYEITGAGPVRSRLQAAAARGLTRFVGRAAEFETLWQALERAGASHGQMVALVGEPGVGKSRLFWEFTHSRRTVDWLILESSSVSYGKATAYLPVIDLLRTYFSIEDRDDVRKIREKVTGKLLTLDKSLEPTLPAFLKPMIHCGTRRKSKWCLPVGCTGTYERTGPRRSSNGVRLPQSVTISPCDSTIATNWMSVIRMATPASRGPSLESMIAPGDRSARYTAKSVTCPMKARRVNSIARLTSSGLRPLSAL
jgi:class 3 adenylate cyclase